ncbi:unnamed protein product [Rhodiola kirilowii]
MASSYVSSSLAASLIHKSNFLGYTLHPNALNLQTTSPPSASSRFKISARFNLFEILGGRGLLNGEKGLQLELQRTPTIQPTPNSNSESETPPDPKFSNLPEDSFDKELLGLTGGFPGGEKGLKKFIEANPPPPKAKTDKKASPSASSVDASSKSKAPELPLLMPGMIAIVKNPNNPFYMYCGIVQRITDGKVGVLFEGGVWDRMMTFRLDELERRAKGPPMKNPRSCILEPLIEQK